jgi:alpha-galactosidase
MDVTCQTRYSDIRILEGTTPVARYTSGLTLFDEGLSGGHWLHRYWSPIGRIEPDPVLRGPALHNSAFGLEVDGQSLHHGWQWVGAEEPPAARAGQKHVAVTLQHESRPVTVRVHTVVDGTPLLMRWLEIENTGEQPAALSQVWVWSGRVFPCQVGENYWGPYSKYHTAHGDYTVGYFVDNKHSSEGHFQWQPVGRQALEITEDTGASGWGHPICYLRDGQAGNIFVAQLAWSGNWKLRVERHDNRIGDPDESEELIYLRIGPWAPGPMRVLEPGERISTPAVHLGGMAGDLTDMVQALHEHQRRSVILEPPAGGANLISYNHWSYMKHEMSEERLLREIDIAADAGAEVFTIDAGWYGSVSQDWHMVGRWRPGDRLPRGFKPIWEHARRRGLKCGLWVWIEGASQDSPIIQEHPDWLLERDGERINNHLDLAKPEVAAWVEAEIVRIVQEYDIDLFRLDYNITPGEGGYNLRHGFAENTIWRHYEAMYGIWERVRQRFPNLILETCAGGGKRTDLGTVSRFHFTWISDYCLSPRSVRMLNGMLLALAPELTVRMVGAGMNACLGGDLDLQLRHIILAGNPCLSGLWPTPEDANPVAEERVRHAAGLFKEHVRPLIRMCRVYHHTPEIGGLQPTGWYAVEYAAPDASKAIAGVFRLAGEAESEYRLKLRGLAHAGRYQVYFDNAAETVKASGRELMEEGLVVHLLTPMSSELVIATVLKAD